MSDVRVWLGPTGSGKSTRIVEELAEETIVRPVGPPIFWVVPDDVAFAAEQMLMERIPSVLRAEVITLSRLAERILQMSGGNALQPINGTGKRMLLASAYQEMRDELGPLKRAQANSGFFQMLLDTFDEMTEHHVDLGALQGALEAAASSLASVVTKQHTTAGRSLLGKLRDLCILYVRYRALLEERSFFDPAMTLSFAAGRVSQVPWIADAIFYVDGFQLITPQQTDFIGALAQHASRCTVAFSLPGDEQGELALFRDDRTGVQWPGLAPLGLLLPRIQASSYSHIPGAAYAYGQFLFTLKAGEIPWTVESFDEDPGMAEGRFRGLERVLRRESDSVAEPLHDDALRMWKCSSDEAEVREVAREIVQAVEVEGMNYRDIAVIVPSLQDFGGRLHSIFTNYGIPHAIDEFPPLAAHPLGRFCLASLRLITEDLSSDAMARYLRTEYCGLSETDADWFDIYVRTHGISGYEAWFEQDAWRYATGQLDEHSGASRMRDDERAEGLRNTICKSIGPLFTHLGKAILTPETMALAIWELLVAVDAKRRVAAQVVSEDVDNNPLQASQDEQAWQQVIGLLNDLATVHRDAPFLREELFEMVTEAFLTQSQSTIPSGVDQVFISAYSRAHMWKRPYVFVLGLDEKSLPAKVSAGGLLQDEEREVFAQLFGTPLGWTTVERLAIDKVIPYMLLTRATKHLVLSYAAMRGSAEQQPSPLYIRVLPLASRGVEEVEDGNITTASEEAQLVMHASVALDFVLRQLAQAKKEGNLLTALEIPHVRDSLAWFMQSPSRTETLFRGLRGLFHRLPDGQLEGGLALRLYGTPLQTSVHRLETYASCPYQYYLRYGLGIEPLSFDTMQAADVGNLLHDTVFALMNAWLTGQLDMQNATLAEVLEFASGEFLAQMESPRHAVFRSRPSRHARFSDLETYVRAVAEVLWLHARQGSFAPYALEWSFGLREDTAASYTMTLDDGTEVKLRGRVDRIDVFPDGENTWFRIIDYKSGANHRIDMTKMFFGLQLQLMVYAAVVRDHLGGKAALPAGAFYMPLLNQPAIVEVPADDGAAKANVRKVLRPQGYMQGKLAAIEAMDRDLTSGKSELFFDVYKQDGTFRKAAKVWSQEEWDALLNFTMDRVRAIATELTSGKIPVRPYIHAHRDRACTTCNFAAVCHFEHGDHGEAYRVLSSKRLEDITERYSTEGANTR